MIQITFLYAWRCVWSSIKWFLVTLSSGNSSLNKSNSGPVKLTKSRNTKSNNSWSSTKSLTKGIKSDWTTAIFPKLRRMRWLPSSLRRNLIRSFTHSKHSGSLWYWTPSLVPRAAPILIKTKKKNFSSLKCWPSKLYTESEFQKKLNYYWASSSRKHDLFPILLHVDSNSEIHSIAPVSKIPKVNQFFCFRSKSILLLQIRLIQPP